ncbi:MAG: RNA-binding S4 domain-containing protein [Fibrobacterota bacterium]
MIFELHGEFIELVKLLKLIGIAESGGEATRMIREGAVCRNGEPETRRRKKVYDGDYICIGDLTITVEQQ